MTLIPAGTFDFLDERGNPPNHRMMTITHDFYLDTLEVSVARFKVWVAAGLPPPCTTGTCTIDPGGPYQQTMVWDSSMWNMLASATTYQMGCTNAASTNINTPTFTQSNDAFPMNCLNWYHAAAFCFSEGKRLPTQTEWQYVATGRGQARTYPWGATDPTDCTLAIWPDNAPGPGYNGCNFPKAGGSAPAGASRDGLLDMAGSVFEWVWDYDGTFPTAPQTDYAGPTTPADRSDRGGSWAYDPSALRATYRDATPPDSSFADVGVRCAKTKL
jgi:formylglycine-generating enzyme required for sulfatase activity